MPIAMTAAVHLMANGIALPSGLRQSVRNSLS
jgi:hypothetical protein